MTRCTVGICAFRICVRALLFQLRSDGFPGGGGQEDVEAVRACVPDRCQEAEGGNQATNAARPDARTRLEKGREKG